MANKVTRIGVVSGVTDELAAFLPDDPGQSLRAAGLPVRRVVHGGKEVYLVCAGIGKVAAASAATALHACFDVDLLMVIGTAAKISEIEGSLFNLTEALQGDFGAQRDHGLVHYTAGSWPIGPASVQAFRAMPLEGLDLPTARIATSDLFIECAAHAARLRDNLGAELIDMETGAVAQTAALLGLPWLAIKATTDGADEDSAGSFVANLQAAATASAEAAAAAMLLL
jgi:nucleoside phosphorylase